MRRVAEVALRRARPEDATAAVAIVGAALAEHQLPFEPSGRDADVASFGAREGSDDFVAELDGTVVGIVSVGPHGDPGVAWVSKLFVVRRARRGGVGRALLSAAHDAARARGYTRVGLRTRVLFRDAVALYEAEGYARSEEVVVLSPDDLVYFRDL